MVPILEAVELEYESSVDGLLPTVPPRRATAAGSGLYNGFIDDSDATPAPDIVPMGRTSREECVVIIVLVDPTEMVELFPANMSPSPSDAAVACA